MAEKAGFEPRPIGENEMLTENKNRVVQVRLTEKDYETLHTIAQRVNMTVSEYVRLLVQGALTTAKTHAKGRPDNAHE